MPRTRKRPPEAWIAGAAIFAYAASASGFLIERYVATQYALAMPSSKWLLAHFAYRFLPSSSTASCYSQSMGGRYTLALEAGFVVERPLALLGSSPSKELVGKSRAARWPGKVCAGD